MAGTYILRSTRPAAGTLFWGIGSSGSPYQWGDANKNGIGLWFKSLASTGDTRGLYLRLYLAGAGGGEAVRAYATVAASGVAAGGTVNGIHASLSINTSSDVSGAGNAARFTLGAASATRTLGGTLAAIQLDSDIGANNTVPATTAFMRVTDSGSVRINRLFNFPAASNSTLVATHVTDAMTHSIKCTLADGTAIYLMATTTATNRGGGS